MSQWFSFPAGISEDSADAQQFRQQVRSYAWRKFSRGLVTIALAAITLVSPLVSAAIAFTTIQPAGPAIAIIGAFIVAELIALVFLFRNRHRLLDKFLPLPSNCPFCQSQMHEEIGQTNHSAKTFLTCPSCHTRGLIGAPAD
ncbi:hypothetical protein [Persicirhabdus sediminis]|uniref:Uncharacterized protein n=1 Tax=Persicirhabdus sediminis TaxID=454144 RepID=A0A8J7ME18_9BACT|nr:hypothetical protein [Persicirhabdus sediminis]MBK1790813.1 hypothetical protein [Persicirhabdus sediminis]